MLVPQSWLTIAALTAPLVAYGYGVISTKYEVRADERAACEQRIASITAQINAAAERQIQEARDAAAKIPDAPADSAELARLCAADKSCRERVRK